jgi:retron-type reverse transcriptase
VYQQLYPIFDKTFIHDSYASRESKGTHAGVRRFAVFARKVSANYTRPAFVLKCDIRKFFEHVNHEILFALLSARILDERLRLLLRRIINSFGTAPGKGLPLGNVTSQLFANIYLNEMDQFVKHALKARYCLRYCDDFVILHEKQDAPLSLVERIRDFLQEQLLLELHPHKVTLRKLRQGTDFLGYVSLAHYTALRTRAKQRMLKRLARLSQNIHTKEDFRKALPIVQSYFGILSHCKGEQLMKRIKSLFEKWW